MKKLLLVVSLVLSAFSFQANAATIPLTSVPGGYLGSFNATKSGAFIDTWTFEVPFISAISASATSSKATFGAKIIGAINGLTATLNGVALKLTTEGTSKELSIDNLLSNAGTQTLIISGTSAGSYGGSIAVAQTPIPAALWLFGSAFMGLFGVSRRKSA